MSSDRPAKKDDWGVVKDMPTKNKTVPLNVGFSDQQMAKIMIGIIPEEMEDKWFIYYLDEEKTMHLHRSWTDFCVCMVKFKKIDGGFAAINAVVNDDPDQYKCAASDENEKEKCLNVIGPLLLGEYSGNVGKPLESWSLLGNHSITPHSN